MDNGERGRRLMAMAIEYLQDMEASYGRKSWNAVVRRAQTTSETQSRTTLRGNYTFLLCRASFAFATIATNPMDDSTD